MTTDLKIIGFWFKNHNIYFLRRGFKPVSLRYYNTKNKKGFKFKFKPRERLRVFSKRLKPYQLVYTSWDLNPRV